MARKRINWTLLIIIILSVTVVSVTLIMLRQWQKKNAALQAYDTGISNFENHQWEDAAKNLGKFLVLEPHNTEVLLKYGQAHLNIRPLELSNIQQAISAYRRITRVERDNYAASRQLVNIYLQIDQPAEAELISKRYLQHNDDSIMREKLALALLRQRKYEEAYDQLIDLIRKDRSYISGYNSLGVMIETHPDEFKDAASKWFREAVLNNPDVPESYICRASYYLRNGDLNKAVADLNKTCSFGQMSAETRVKLANMYSQAEMYQKAQEQFLKAEKQKPDQPLLWLSWSKMAMKTENKELMLKIAKKSMENLKKQPWDFMHIAAELYVLTGHIDSAQEYILKMKHKGVNPEFASYLQGLIAEQQGNQYAAIHHWQDARQKGFQSEKLNILLANAYYKIGDLKSSIKTLQSHLINNPGDYRSRLILARIHFEKKDYDKSLEQIEMANRIYGKVSAETAALELKCRFLLLESSPAINNDQSVQNLAGRINDLAQKFPDSSEIQILKLNFTKAYEGNEKAIKLLKEYKKENPVTMEMELSEADLLIAQKNLKAAVSKLKLLTAKYPQSIMPVKYLASTLFEQGQTDEAESVVTEGIKRMDNRLAKRNLSLFLGMLYKQNEKNEEAYKIFKNLSKEMPDDIIIKRELLSCSEQLTDFEQKQGIVDQIKKLEGEQGWQWRYEQSKIWLASDDFQKYYPQILMMLKKNLKADPQDIESLMLLAEAYFKKGETQLAVATYKQAFDMAPENINILIPTVNALYKVRDYKSAEKILNKARDRDLRHPELLKLELESYLRQDYSELVQSTLEECIARGPKCKYAFIDLAKDLARKNDKDSKKAAENLLNAILNYDPNSTSAMTLLAMLLQNEGRCDESEMLYKEVLDREPNNLTVINNLAWLLSENKSNHKKALDLAQKGLKKAPEYLNLRDTRGVINYRLGNYSQAIDDFRQCLKSYPQRSPAKVVSYFHIGRAFAAAGQRSEALKYLQKAADNNVQVGGLSSKEIAETKQMLIDLKKENYHDPESER